MLRIFAACKEGLGQPFGCNFRGNGWGFRVVVPPIKGKKNSSCKEKGLKAGTAKKRKTREEEMTAG